MDIKAYVPVLTKFRKAEKADALAGKLKPIAKPDADNILKALLDALNEVAYDDDRYIYKISVERIYSDNPRTEVIISDDCND
jgi:Holliday junction resolvase RusA-like endonuclease